MRPKGCDEWEYEELPDALPGHVSSSVDGTEEDRIGDVLLDMLEFLTRLEVLLDEATPEEMAAAKPRLDRFQRRVVDLPRESKKATTAKEVIGFRMESTGKAKRRPGKKKK